MKKKILNILKYSCGLIVACSIFVISLFISVNAQTYEDNILLNNISKIETYCTDNTKYEYTSISIVQNHNINMLDTGYGYEADNNGKDVDYILLNFTQNITINNENNIYMQDFGIDFIVEFYLSQIKQATITTNQLGFYSYKTSQELTFNKIKIISQNFAFEEDSLLIAISPQEILTTYQKGYNDAQAELQPKISQLNNEIQTLRNQNATLTQQYNELATNEYTFENLFWSVGSVPMAFLLQSFNVNVLGMNIAAIITGLITALLILWIIKKLLK